MATQEHIQEMKSKAISFLARTDHITATTDDVQFIKFDGVPKNIGKHFDTGEDVISIDTRNAGQYLIVHSGDQVAAIYKVVVRFGPDRAVLDEHGIVNLVVDSMSFSLKRIKRAPKGLVA
jgi:hypothetical protein